MSPSKKEANKALMASLAAAFLQGDLRPFYEAFDENIAWTSNVPSALFRFGGTHRTQIAFREEAAILFATYTYDRFDLRDITAEDDVVWGLFEIEARHRSTGKKIVSPLAIRWVVKNGKIVEHTEFFDTASVLAQQNPAAK